MAEILKIVNLNKKFGNLEVLKDVNLSLNEGEILSVLGDSGCGKSTLLRTINGLEPVQSGNFIIEGERIDQNFKEWRRIRQKIGMVFQSYELFDHLSVLHNIILGPMKVQNVPKEEAIALAREWLKIVGLADKENSYPKELSGGQKQRIAIVRSLVMKPKIMLFDEVTAALDPEIVREVLDVMLNLAKEGQTMLIVTHEMGFARAVADRIVFMDEGSVVEINEPEAFFTAPKSERAKKFLNMFEFKK